MQQSSPRRAPAIRDLLAAGDRSFSFEFMPPKTAAEERRLWLAVRQLEPLQPTFVSVTYGAGGSTRDRTVRITGQIAAETTLTPVGHFTAVNHSVAELRHVIGSYAAVGVRNVLALRGDPPGAPDGEWVPHPDGLCYADELVRLVKASGDFCVGVAAFPEGHPRRVSIAVRPRPSSSVSAGPVPTSRSPTCSSTRTTTCGCATAVAALGCDVPIIAGIMPITSVAMIERAALLSGARFPPELAERLRSRAGDKAAVREIGVDYATGHVRAADRRGRTRAAFLHAERVAGDPRDLSAARPRPVGCACPAAAARRP